MKKLLLAAGLATVVYGGWQWQHRDTQRDGTKIEVYNRLWIDHIPLNERDAFQVFIAHTPEGIGGFAEETQWRGQIERFRFQPAPGEIRAVFPWTNDRETIKVEAKKCDAEGFDYCLELTGSNHGVKKYYSRKQWARRGFDDIDAIRAELLR
jgi:hypothetical protein